MNQQTAIAERRAIDTASWPAIVVLSSLFGPHPAASTPDLDPSAQPNLEPARLELLELWPRVLVAARVDTAATGTALDVRFAADGAPFSLSHQRAQSGFVLRVNSQFVAENERLIEGMLLANRLNLQDSFRTFALERAVALGIAGTDTALVVRTFNESIGWSAEGFERVRSQAGFHEAAIAPRLQGFSWLLARVVIHASLPQMQGARPATEPQDQRAARLAVEITGSPFPPLPTGLLTAALEHSRDDARTEAISCAAAGWLATGITVMRSLPEFDRRMERDPRLRRSMEGVSKDLAQLRDRGHCTAPL